jgi:folate-binding protein YgfZ
LCLDKDIAASTHKNAASDTKKMKYIPTDSAMKEWDALRILQGRPYPDKELTLEITPLEAGLWHTVDFAKGCYLGQETLAKVANNKGERQKLYGFELNARGGGEEVGKVEEGMRLVDAAGKRAGAVTSYLPEKRVGLAYIRKSVGTDPMAASLFLEEKDGSKAQTQIRVIDIPYAVRSATSSSSSSPTAGAAAAGGGKSGEDAAAAAAATAAAAAEKAAEAERKAQKLAEMQARLAAFQAKQKKG